MNLSDFAKTGWDLDEETLRFVTDWWTEEYADLLKAFDPVRLTIPNDFLVRLWGHGGFFMEDIEVHYEELDVIRQHFPDWELMLADAAIPHVIRQQTLYNTTTTHHLYHLARWEQTTGVDIRDLSTVVEWGGGYGSFARLCLRRNPKLHYTIIDLPLMSSIQLRYLEIWGLDDRFSACRPQKAKGLLCDLFVATWSLDESTHFAQGFAGGCFYKTMHWLIAHHPNKPEFPHSDGLKDILPPDLFRVPTPFPDSFYEFR